MGIHVGIDAGSVSLKVAALISKKESLSQEDIAASGGGFRVLQSAIDYFILTNDYQRLKENPLTDLQKIFVNLFKIIPVERISSITVTGSGSKLLSEKWGFKYENEFKALAKAVEVLYPEVRTILEIGGSNSKYIRFQRNNRGQSGICDYETNGDCAAGTGSFIDQQSSRLLFKIEEIGERAFSAAKSARIAGRCSVFAKSDMIHAQQKGYTPDEILMGLCEGVVRNFKSSIVKGKKIEPKVLFTGGVAQNRAVRETIRKAFNLEEEDFSVPEGHLWFGAIGAALVSREAENLINISAIKEKFSVEAENTVEFPYSKPLSMDKVVLLRNHVKLANISNYNHPVRAFLGIDIGSVSTNLVLVDAERNVLKEIYLRTNGRPVEVVNNGLREIEKEFGKKILIAGVGTTGSGRELIGELTGADVVTDEITAHKTASQFISKKYMDEEVDTIIEIGGQDSKFISLKCGIVVDFAMNEACAAGTGSFLEEQAERLGIRIKEEFAQLALSSTTPIKMGERCTVFIENDIKAYQLKGAKKKDLIAGLAYSVVLNYLNRVVKGRKIGEVIYFQGGTAYNDAVAAAFSSVLEKRIIVPPFNGCLGALGVALVALERIEDIDNPAYYTKFRGFELNRVNYSLREFSCKACSNSCDIQEFMVEGIKTYWGDKCSEQFRKRSKTETKPVISDLLKFREALLLEKYQPEPFPGKTTIGFPRAMYFYEYFPFWNRLFTELGFNFIISDESNKKILNEGIDLTVAEPCFPIKIAHGHVANLMSKKVDFIFIPSLINSETDNIKLRSFFCPWGQTLPWVVRNVPRYRDYSGRFLTPIVHFREGEELVMKELAGYLKKNLNLNEISVKAAVKKAFEELSGFRARCLDKGKEAMEQLAKNRREGIILIGRLYNIYDRMANINLPQKLRDYYGINLLPMDFLTFEDLEIDSITDNMFWNYGRKLLKAAKFSSSYPNLHLISITNFKCGPDSYIKHYLPVAAKKPFLTLQFDEHSNDAGMITRCEAYLDSKGVFKCKKQTALTIAA